MERAVTTDHDKLAALAAPFPPESVSWRVGTLSKDKSKGMALAYIDSRDVQDRLDSVMGADWQDELTVQSNGLVACRIGLLIDGAWRWRMDSTAALAPMPAGEEDAKAEQAREMAQKGAASDAFKRAAVKWGIGRYLYSLPTPWVAVNQWRQIEDDARAKLLDVLRRHAREIGAAAPTPEAGQADPPKSPSYIRLERELSAATNVAELATAWARGQAMLKDMPDEWLAALAALKDRMKADLSSFTPPMQAAE